MATPSGARHRDLEQRFRDLEQQGRALAGAVARRQPLTGFSGNEVAYLGAAPPAGATQVVRATTRQAATDGSGHLTVTLPTPYDNGIVAVHLAADILDGAAVTVNTVKASSSLAQVTVLVSDASGNVVMATPVLITCTAIGW